MPTRLRAHHGTDAGELVAAAGLSEVGEGKGSYAMICITSALACQVVHAKCQGERAAQGPIVPPYTR